MTLLLEFGHAGHHTVLIRQGKLGMRHCALFGEGGGDADANDVRRLMTLPRPGYRPRLTLERHAREACRIVRRMLALARTERKRGGP